MKRYQILARESTNIYKILKSKYSNRYNNEQLLYASGLILAFPYVHQGKISIISLCHAATHCVKFGECQTLTHIVNHIGNQKGYSPNETEQLINFIMQLECLIFDVEPHEKYINIPQSLVFNKKGFEKIIQKTLEQSKETIDYQNALESVSEFMEGDLPDEFKEIMKTIDISPSRILEEEKQKILASYMKSK